MNKLFFFIAVLTGVVTHAQAREVPEVVKESFAKKYPDADSIKFQDNIINVHVTFQVKGEKMDATFSNKGEWKQTEKNWDYNQLDPEIQEGFLKSKYANDWKVKETVIIYLPDGSERWRMKVARNDLQKKYLFFDKTGRMIRDSFTI